MENWPVFRKEERERMSESCVLAGYKTITHPTAFFLSQRVCVQDSYGTTSVPKKMPLYILLWQQ